MELVLELRSGLGFDLKETERERVRDFQLTKISSGENGIT